MIKITKPAALTHTQYCNCLVYGESGIGKTVLCTTAPKPLIMSAEQGLLSIADQDIDVTEVKSLSDIIGVYNYLQKGSEYETICLDSLSEIAQTVLAEYKAIERDPRQAYGKLGEEVLSLIRKFRDLPMNVVFIAKQDRVIDELSGRQNYGPLFPGRILTAEVPYQIDVVMAMRFNRKDGKSYRVLQTEADIQYAAKDRTGKLEKFEKPDLGALITKVTGAIQMKLVT